MSDRFYEFGPFRVDTVNHVLLRDGEPLPLKPKVFDTLLVLVESRGRVLDKDELMRRLWPDTVVEEANLTQNIYLLRKALGEESHGGAYIETMPKRGYQFVASVRVLEAGSPALAPEESAAAGEERRQPAGSGGGEAGPAFLFGRRRAATLALAALALAAAFVFVPIPKRPEQAAPPSIRSVAVLPFKPLGPDAGDESLGFGMADTLITRLSNIRQLIVRPTGAVRRFASPDQDPVAAGRELKVDEVLEASIQRAGDRIRVTLRLVRVSDGAPLWAGKFDEPAGDVLAVQDRVSEQVAQALVPRMTGEEQRLVAKRYTENPEAYRLYMLGRHDGGGRI
jgi:DNA-binding winged helix-turn-helix (wHTH) protein/TolB-like protein